MQQPSLIGLLKPTKLKVSWYYQVKMPSSVYIKALVKQQVKFKFIITVYLVLYKVSPLILLGLKLPQLQYKMYWT